MVDSDIIIWHMRGRADIGAQLEAAAGESGGMLYVTAVQVCEVMTGLRPRESAAARAALTLFQCAALDAESGLLAAEFRARFAKSHHLTLADSLIAAAARTRGLVLWTLNKKHYPMLRSAEMYSPG